MPANPVPPLRRFSVPKVEFQRSADPDALEVVVDDEHLGSLQRHPERSARFVLTAGDKPLVSLEVSVLEQIVARSNEFSSRPATS